MATLSVFVSGYGVLRDSHYPDNVVRRQQHV